ATLLAYEAHCALSDFRGKLAWLLVHGSILSRVGASTKLGAVHKTPGALPISIVDAAVSAKSFTT
ncbi:hypothetical protein, partial [Burkholderia vietnamiensis]|uniref:hypothetical protein n=1 Tax=Burkholderia vietnamiensis TaxID=60552 RepID=UPI001E30337F